MQSSTSTNLKKIFLDKSEKETRRAKIYHKTTSENHKKSWDFWIIYRTWRQKWDGFLKKTTRRRRSKTLRCYLFIHVFECLPFSGPGWAPEWCCYGEIGSGNKIKCYSVVDLSNMWILQTRSKGRKRRGSMKRRTRILIIFRHQTLRKDSAFHLFEITTFVLSNVLDLGRNNNVFNFWEGKSPGKFLIAGVENTYELNLINLKENLQLSLFINQGKSRD